MHEFRLRAKGGARTLCDVVNYGLRSGRWWLPITMLLLVVLSVVTLVTAKIVVPTVVYTLF